MCIHSTAHTHSAHMHTYYVHIYAHKQWLSLIHTYVILDINECDNSPCQQHCNNTLGSFHCTCRTGYMAVGTKCNGQ